MDVDIIRFDKNEVVFDPELLVFKPPIRTKKENVVSFLSFKNGNDLIVRFPKRKGWGINRNDTYGTYSLTYERSDVETVFNNFITSLEDWLRVQIKETFKSLKEKECYEIFSGDVINKFISDDVFKPIFVYSTIKEGKNKGKDDLASPKRCYIKLVVVDDQIKCKGFTMKKPVEEQALTDIISIGPTKVSYIPIVILKSVLYNIKERTCKVMLYMERLYFSKDSVMDNDDLLGEDGYTVDDEDECERMVRELKVSALD